MSRYPVPPPPYGTPNYPNFPPGHPQARARTDQPPAGFPPNAPYYPQQYQAQAPVQQQQQYPVPPGAYAPGQTQGYVPYGQQQQHHAFQQARFNPDARGVEYAFGNQQQAPPPIKYPPQEGTRPMIPEGSAPMYWGNEGRNPAPMAAPAAFNEVEARQGAANAFDRFDQDNGGYLDLQEFMDALRALHLAISYHDALDCFARSDTNEDGRIGKHEFINICIEEMKKRRF